MDPKTNALDGEVAQPSTSQPEPSPAATTVETKPAATSISQQQPGPSSPPAEPTDQWHRIAEASALQSTPEGRLHVRIDGRYVSIMAYEDKLYCLDSVCFHAGGPLALGDIEELDGGGNPCLVCPWHFYHVSLRDGEKWYQAAEKDEDGKLHAGKWKSVGRRQRVHAVEERAGGIYVKLNLDGALASDEYACKSECGGRVKAGALRLNVGGLAEHRDGARSPGRPSSPLRGTPPASPRGPIYMDAEDVWPEDLVAEGRPHRSPSRRRSSSLNRGDSSMS